jgi:hypothetical protein
MQIIDSQQQVIANMHLNGFSHAQIADKLKIQPIEIEMTLGSSITKMYLNEILARDTELLVRKSSLEGVYKFLPKLIEALTMRVDRTSADQGLKMTDIKLIEILMKEIPKVHNDQMQKIMNVTNNFYQQNNLIKQNDKQDIITSLISKIPAEKQMHFWKEIEVLAEKYAYGTTKLHEISIHP